MNLPHLLDGQLALCGPAAGGAPAWGLIRASGADAAGFLHTQLTNDIAGLGEGEARLAGYCSPKGRLLASFLVWREAEDVLLACHPGVLAATLKRLSMFVLRARCRLSDATAEYPVEGLAGAHAAAEIENLAPWQQQLDGAVRRIRLPDAAGVPRGLRIGAAVVAGGGSPALAPESWRWLEVQSGLPQIEAATADRFVPQMLNYEAIGGVSFRKGCYPGQEVVARSQYRGTVKRRMFLFELEPQAGVPAPATEVYEAGDPVQPAGMVVNGAAHPAGGPAAALVEVKLASVLAGSSLHLGGVAGPRLVRRELPYPLPLDADRAA